MASNKSIRLDIPVLHRFRAAFDHFLPRLGFVLESDLDVEPVFAGRTLDEVLAQAFEENRIDYEPSALSYYRMLKRAPTPEKDLRHGWGVTYTDQTLEIAIYNKGKAARGYEIWVAPNPGA